MADQVAGSDAPVKPPVKDAVQQPSFDSPQLLAQFDSVVGNQSGQNGQSGQSGSNFNSRESVLQPNTKGGTDLVFDNAFSAADSFGDDLTRAVKSKQGDRRVPLPPERPDSIDPRKSITVLDSAQNLDPSKPTVVVLDDFRDIRRNTEPLDSQGNGLPHGEPTAQAARQNGFNVVRVQDNTTAPWDGTGANFAMPLMGIEQKINSGELPLGKGDVINISLGNNPDLSFTKVSSMLQTKGGMPDLNVTPENLAANKDRILQGMQAIVNNPASTPEERKIASRIVDTNAAIQRLQDKGITVVHAAGNNGPGEFSPDFMSAAVQLRSQRPDGTPDPFSANHSLAKPADGIFGVVANPFRNLAGEGTVPGFRLTGTDITFAAPAGAVQTNGLTLDMSKPVSAPLQFGQAPFLPGGGQEVVPNDLPVGLKMTMEKMTPNLPITGILGGTSFANIRWLQENRDSLLQRKLNN